MGSVVAALSGVALGDARTQRGRRSWRQLAEASNARAGRPARDPMPCDSERRSDGPAPLLASTAPRRGQRGALQAVEGPARRERAGGAPRSVWHPLGSSLGDW